MSATETPQHGKSHESTECWWDKPIPNGTTAAYQIGRYLNQLNWHFQHILFFSRRTDRKIVDEVLGRLMALSYEFAASPTNHLYDTIGLLRDDWKMWLCCEAACDEAAECYDDRSMSYEETTSKERRRDLVATRVRGPLVEKLRNVFFKVMTDEEKWAVELGSCVDQGVRRSDIADFFEWEITFSEPESSAETHASNNEPDWLIEERNLPAFEAGEVVADSAWPHRLQALMRKGRMSVGGAIAYILSKHTNLHDRHARLTVTEQLDQEIRERLGHTSDDFARPSGSEHDLSDQPLRERADGHPTIPDEYLSRMMTKQEAAIFHNGQAVSNPTAYFQRLIDQNRLTPPNGSGQRWQFDVRDFPANVRDEIRQPPKPKTNKPSAI